MKSVLEYILEMDANKLPANIKVDDDQNGTLIISFGKNGWGLSTELIRIGEIVHKISKEYNIYLKECKIDELDDVYDFVFNYDNKHFDD